MASRDDIRKDLETLRISEDQELTKGYVTAQYKARAKETHPDRPGGVKADFQKLQNAYKRIINFLEEEGEEDENLETAFFMKHNFMKE